MKPIICMNYDQRFATYHILNRRDVYVTVAKPDSILYDDAQKKVLA